MMPIEHLTDQQLLERMPEPEAVRAFYERHVDAVLRFAIRRCRESQDAADLVSVVFLELFTAARGFDAARGEARSWLLGIASRCLADQQRMGHRQAALGRRLGGRIELAENQYERVEQLIDAERYAPAVERALSEHLTDREREPFLLVAEDGLTPAEAASVLGLRPVAARMRLSRARRKLHAALGLDATHDLTREPIGSPERRMEMTE